LGAASRDKADAFLDEQIGLAKKQSTIADLQIEDLKREDKLRHWSLIVHHFSDVLKLAFEFAVAAIVLGILALLTGAVWSAAHENGLVIEAFSVPPDMATRGLTGQAVAAQLQDKLSAMQAATVSTRPAASYSNNWGNDIKVEIPNTGVSIGEFYRYLVSAFGRQTHITGEVYRTANGIAITARASGDGGATASGAETSMDGLLQQAAENIYGHTQPYRYAVYLQAPPRLQTAKARKIFEQLTEDGSPRERKWANVGIAVQYVQTGDFRTSVSYVRKALALDPGFALAWLDADFNESALGHDEAALAAERKAIPILQSGNDIDMSDQAKPSILLLEQTNSAFSLSDFNAVLSYAKQELEISDFNDLWESAREGVITSLALLHDPRAAREHVRDLPSTGIAADRASRLNTQEIAAYWSGDWQDVVRFGAAYDPAFRVLGAKPSVAEDGLARQSWPYQATALAHLGNLNAANALIDKTPRDCYACIRNRADIAAMEKRWGAADYWFAMAVQQAPSIPMAYWDWGRVLLEHGDIDGAIAKFNLSSEKGPHFANPLEGLGEALMAQNRSDLALAKFEAANREAPNWARLHLKWGEALFYAGQKDEAQKQFAIAASLELSPNEKSELTKMMHGRR
jgi:tetratricopeptide (TPR) repeat protein